MNESEIENKMSEYTIKAGFQIDAWAVFNLLTTAINFKTILSPQQLLELPQGQHQFVRQGDQAHEDFPTHAIILIRWMGKLVRILEKIHHIGWQEPI